jgi:hypothetical protein
LSRRRGTRAVSQIDQEFKTYLKKLEKLNAEALPRIVAETINLVAGFAHVASIRNVRQRFVLRTKWTEGSVRYYKANPKKDWKKINAVTGSISPYMDEQDLGGDRKAKGGGLVPVATLAARGGSASKRKAKRYHLGQELKGNPKLFIGKPRGQGRNAGKPVGIYERRGKKKIRPIHTMESKSVPIKATRWHRDAVTASAKSGAMKNEFIRQAKAELARLGTK